MGSDPKISALDSDCKIFNVPNVYVVDSSFLPNLGGIPPTWTIMANAFRVAKSITRDLKSRKL
jgi:choline dehydrogenase-like flavoprotein